MKKMCPYCGRSGELGSVCPGCGYVLQVSDENAPPQNCDHGMQIPQPQITVYQMTMDAECYSNPVNTAPQVPPVASHTYVNTARAKNKWLALFFSLFFFCGHKFYEGKILLGVVYLFTAGLFFIGWFFDVIRLLFKPTTYYV